MTEQEQKSIFENWLALHKGLIFKIVRAYAFTPVDREDLFQDVATQVWKSVPSFRKESAITTWIYRVALNTSIRWIKSARRLYPTESLDHAQHVLHENSVDERLEWLYAKIHRLDAIDRSIALLMLDGFSYKEMANLLGITETNVGVKINRIKKLLITQSKSYRYGI